jgi:hypothetical protein
MTAATVCASGECKIMVIRLDETGDTLWTKNYGQSGCNEYSSAIRRTPDGDYVILGMSFCTNRRIDDIILIKIDENGDTLWTKIYTSGIYNSIYSIIATPDGGFAFTGTIYDPQAHRYDTWIVRLGSEAVGIDEPGPLLPAPFFLSQNYPNPFNAQTTIQYYLPNESIVTIDIFDILGRKIETLVEGIMPAGNRQATWDAGGQSSGLYFYKIKAGDYIETKMCLLLK